ncbi:hypothetical protein ACFU6E_13390 [Bacillus cereus]|uniref:hypothetical protein n=1 Tax=Bacillus cereus TaxID=1396 RepID=UPI003672D965
MTFITTGLPNSGRTTYYQIQYDDSLSQSDGLDRAKNLMEVCDDDFNLMSGWFGGIQLTVAIPITVNISSGPYASANWSVPAGSPMTLIPGDGSSVDLVRYLLVAEVTEMFMMAQKNNIPDSCWFGIDQEGSAGEGLSRFLGAQFLAIKGLNTDISIFSTSNDWMTSSREDFVNHVDLLDHRVNKEIGCSILFIYYLNVELGLNIESIIAAAAPSLAGVYKNLTRNSSDPFPFFKQILDNAFPGTKTIPGNNPDNPFPLRFPNWQQLDNNTESSDIVTDGNNLYQLHNDGGIWQYTGTPMTGWAKLDNNTTTKKIAVSGGNLYQIHSDGSIWQYTGTPMTGWAKLDNNPATFDIVADGNDLYQQHNDGSIWQYTGTPMTGWTKLDNNPATKKIAVSGGNLYQIHTDGSIWQYTGTPMTGWAKLDNNPATKKIAVSGGNLYQIHSDGSIWQYTGTPMTGWAKLDNNPATFDIVADGNDLYQLHTNGRIWKYTGTPLTGWQELDYSRDAIKIVASGGHLYQFQDFGSIWLYTG